VNPAALSTGIRELVGTIDKSLTLVNQLIAEAEE
jgi:hypothetical protein